MRIAKGIEARRVSRKRQREHTSATSDVATQFLETEVSGGSTDLDDRKVLAPVPESPTIRDRVIEPRVIGKSSGIPQSVLTRSWFEMTSEWGASSVTNQTATFQLFFGATWREISSVGCRICGEARADRSGEPRSALGLSPTGESRGWGYRVSSG